MYYDKVLEEILSFGHLILDGKLKVNPNIKSQYTVINNLSSYYVDSYYMPALIVKTEHFLYRYYLFDGKIVNIDHPVLIMSNKQAINVIYYSTYRYENDMPVRIYASHIGLLNPVLFTRDYATECDLKSILEYIPRRALLWHRRVEVLD